MNECELHFCKESELWVVTPFERPDIELAQAVEAGGAFPVVHLGRDKTVAQAALAALEGKLTQPFGVCLVDADLFEVALPAQVSRIVLPWGSVLPQGYSAEVVWQVHSEEEARAALDKKVQSLILKGSEGAGRCGNESSFILFQRIQPLCEEAGVALYIQGGVGVHTGAAYLALGAKGLILDSQVALFPECGSSNELRSTLDRLSGNEIRISEGYHYFVSPGTAELAQDVGLTELLSRIAEGPDKGVIAVGQDVVLASDFLRRYRHLKHLLQAIRQAEFADVSLAKSQDLLGKDSALAKDLQTDYALTQGPMARISDVSEFLGDVASGGALPFLAMSMMVGSSAENILAETATALEGKPWGVGILGFTFPKILAEQTELILKAKPPVVLIAGGRPAQAKVFEKAGIKVFLHVPAAGLLDMFLKEGASNFIFEGRESGGHVGPLFSTVLWEKQLNRLLLHDNPSSLRVLFAGGLHDAFSAAFVRVFAAPLVARDSKVGLQLGTAYLYTDEIVTSGAITEEYRQQIISKDTTVLLQSGKGQETRAVPSAFTDLFFSEKERLREEGLEFAEVLMKLEELNLGRLRVSAKGVERQGDKLVTLNSAEQRERGLYMTGSVTALIDKPTTIAALHERIVGGSLALLDTMEPQKPQVQALQPIEVAIVGMECIFPDAADKDEYWRNILFGRNSIREVPHNRWNPALFYDPDPKDTDHVPSKWGGFIDPVDFDALEFGITPQSLAAIEPVQLLSLLVAKRALEDAGYEDLSKVDLEDTSVIFGAQGAGELTAQYGSRSGLTQFFGALPQEAAAVLPRLTEDSFPGMLSNVIAGRISNRLNAGGRNYTVDAACASSLAALDIAYSELASGKSNMVLLGGADVHNGINDFLMFASTHALSRKGRSATFDSQADGIALGEGIGVLVLKRLEDAKRDNNHIYAILKGVGGSSDGRSLGLTAPGRRGQIKALERAYANAGVRPSEVGLVEAHGTGTMVGDRIELSALTDVFLEAGTVPARTHLGSVKSQIGHTKCTAGVAGLIKAVLCVQHGLLPPTLHLNEPTSIYTKTSPFAFKTTKTGLWNEDKRLAGVSAFGFGGTNFHAILQNFEQGRPDCVLRTWPAELFVFRGASSEDAQDLMRKIQVLYATNNRLKIRDIAYSLATYSDEEVRFVLVASSRDELLSRLELALAGESAEGVYPVTPLEGKVALLFPGQGSQRIDMAADLFVVFPSMRRMLMQHPELEKLVFPDTVFTDEAKQAQRNALTDTRAAQPLLGIVDLAIAELLKGFGVRADMLAGHSYGELPALCFASSIAPEDLVDLSLQRAQATLAALGEDPGRMVAVFADGGTVTELLADSTDIWAVNFNAPGQTVVAGTSAAVECFLQQLTEAQLSFRELKVAGAFHSPLLAAAEGNFAQVLEQIDFNEPAIPIWSNTTATAYPQEASAIRERLSKQLVNPVRFVEEIEGMYEAGARVFVEVGPGGTLSGLVDKIVRDREHIAIQTERAGTEGLTYLLNALARYLASGRTLIVEKLFEGRAAQKLQIDSPENYKKNGTVWNVDGYNAIPEQGELPIHAAKAMQSPLMSLDQLRSAYPNANVEAIMMAYLDNMNAAIQDQRDVLLGYLGSPELIPRASSAPRQIVVGASQPSLPVAPSGGSVVATEVAEITTELPDILSLSSAEITDLVLDIVSEKTGYPIDMLGLEVDLEADLSIDSIKKMEIIGGLRDRTIFPEGAEDMEESFERMVSIKTIQEMVAWIKELGSHTGEGSSEKRSTFTGATAVGAVPAAPPSAQDEESIVRMSIIETALPLGVLDGALLEGKAFALTDDGSGLAISLAEELIRRKASAHLITADTVDLSSFDGLILINAVASTNHYTIYDLFNLIKRSDEKKLHWILTFDDTVGALLCADNLSEIKQLEGFPGFIKSLHHEFPTRQLRAVSFQTAIARESFARIAADEIASADVVPEVLYQADERLSYLPAIQPLTPHEEDKELALDKDSTVIVLGGAQGITPVLLARFARQYPCTYLLAGRSGLTSENEAYASLTTRDEIRAYLIETEGMKQPKEIEAKVNAIFKTNQIVASLRLVEDAGATVVYHQVDVTNPEALRGFLQAAREEYGSIDGLIQAAGILEDKLFRNKDIESFRRVYETKAAPLAVIVEELLDELKLFVFFSSMSSAFGNPGQSDYAAGNSVFDLLAQVLSRKKPALRTIAFNWGPWKGAGMVNSGLEDEFRRKGISFLQLDSGGDFFVSEIIEGSESNVLAIAGVERELSTFIQQALR